MATKRVITAAGGVIWRRAQSGRRGGIELLLIHRPRYDDWTFPKGKSDRGETLQQTAVREIAEETGLTVRLGAPLSRVDYRVSSGNKQISYWMARVHGTEHEDVVPNSEVDEMRWVRPRKAATMLSYQHDRELLEEFRSLRDLNHHKTRTLIVLRHAKAQSRNTFKGSSDLDRPLTKIGAHRAQALVPLLGAYAAQRVVTSPAVRCSATVEPYGDSIGTFLEVDDRLSEETTAKQVQRSIEVVLDRKKPAVLCSHRPTLPWVFRALGIETVDLKPGEGVIVHHRRGKVVATERI